MGSLKALIKTHVLRLKRAQRPCYRRLLGYFESRVKVYHGDKRM